MCRVPKGTPIIICHFYQPMNWLATLLWYLRHHSIGCPHSGTYSKPFFLQTIHIPHFSSNLLNINQLGGVECCSNYPQPTVWIVEKHSTPSNHLSYSHLQRFCGMWNVF